MSFDNYIPLLEKLSNALGPSGFEDEVREIVLTELKKLTKKVNIDTIGNVIGYHEGSGPKIGLFAHMDEVSLIITHIEKNGFLRFHTLGGIVPHALYSQRVIIITEKGKKIPGYIGIKAPHLFPLEERRKAIPIDQLFIDVGADSEEEVRDLGIREGCFAVFATKFTKLTKYRVMGKAFDDRVGLTVMLKVLERLKDEDVNLIVVGTVQEEVGLRGAHTAAWITEPDIALALECTAAADIPGTPSHKMSTQLGRGPAITVADRSIVVSPKVIRLLIEAAKKAKVPYQFKEMPVGGTDAGIIYISKKGALAGVVSCPGRYIHSPAAIIDLRDLDSMIKMITEFVKIASRTFK